MKFYSGGLLGGGTGKWDGPLINSAPSGVLREVGAGTEKGELSMGKEAGPCFCAWPPSPNRGQWESAPNSFPSPASTTLVLIPLRFDFTERQLQNVHS